jgi:DNA-binding NtrC family response regulator
MDGENLIEIMVSPEIGGSVVVMTAHADVDRAVRCMRKGADYFFQKPLDLDHVTVILDKLEEKTRLHQEATRYRKLCELDGVEEVIVGQSAAMEQVRGLLDLLAENPFTPVLITGESGTGKELVARSIHRAGAAKEPFVQIHCPSLNQNLLESELFGHERGAFTDARQQKKGLLELAGSGTVFLDELTEMPLPVQAKLLRVLDTGTFRRVGGLKELNCSARIMAATNRDIEARAAAGTFREDLYYRLKVFPVRIPPLRERREDILSLAQYFVADLAKRMCREPVRLSPEALGALHRYDWPGNVRELRNVIERSLILCRGDVIAPRHLPAEIRSSAPPDAQSQSSPCDLRSLREVTVDHVVSVVEQTGNNHSQAARILGISRSTLLAHLKRGKREGGEKGAEGGALTGMASPSSMEH